jgi:hypothetical protein
MQLCIAVRSALLVCVSAVRPQPAAAATLSTAYTAATATAVVQIGYVLGGDIGTGKSSLTSLVGATLVSHLY